MKFALCLAALVSVAFAGVTHEEHQAFIKRQTNIQRGVAANAAAMSDANGNVVAFDTSNVHLAHAARGL